MNITHPQEAKRVERVENSFALNAHILDRHVNAFDHFVDRFVLSDHLIVIGLWKLIKIINKIILNKLNSGLNLLCFFQELAWSFRER